MANELGRTVIHRYLYARSWGLGDRKLPSATTPCLIQLTGDPEISAKLAPFSTSTDNEIPATLIIDAKLPLSPPDFQQPSPQLIAKIGHVLPPSLEEADAGELAETGALLPLSWQRLNHDSKLTDSNLQPSIVVLVDAVQLAVQKDKLVRALSVIKNRFPGALIWTPGLGGPDNAAVLVWFGVDLFDLSRSRQCMAANLLLTESGPRELVDDTDDSADMSCQITQWNNALKEIKSHLASGTLRTLVERQSLNSPKLVEHLRHHDKLSRSNSNLGISHVDSNTILHCNSAMSLENPIITKWVDYMTNNYVAPAGIDNVLILLPCSARKPYRMSKSHRKFIDAIGISSHHEVMITSPLGLVPRDLEEVWPASHYDIPVTGDWSLDEFARSEKMVNALLSRHNYHTVINHSSMSFKLDGVKYIETRNNLPATSKDALENLRQAVAEINREHSPRNRRHHRILVDNFQSVARYKMNNDHWLKGVKVRGKPPYWKIELDGKQIAQWSNDRRGFSLSKSSVKLIADNSSLKTATIKPSIKWKGDVFSSIVESFDDGITSGDDVLILQNNQPIGLARATASGWEWDKIPGIVAKGHQRI